MNQVLPSLSKQLLVICYVLLICACSPIKPDHPATVQAKKTPVMTPAERLAMIDQLAKPSQAELSIQPLQDSAITDLLEQAQKQRAAGELKSAHKSIEQALHIAPENPLALQEQAEIALLLQEWSTSEQFAQHALNNGSQTGPLCRRHWATIEQARQAQGQTQAALTAHEHIAACRVGGE